MAAVMMATVSHAQKPEVVTTNEPGWHKIGDANVNFKSDKDEFVIFGKDRFRKILVKVTDAPVHMEDLQVIYDNGYKEDIPIRNDFRPGSDSRAIDLKNHEHGLKKVVFFYKTVPNYQVDKAHIELWGLK